MIFGKVERRRTERTSSESLTKRAKIVAFWRVLTQSPMAPYEGSRGGSPALLELILCLGAALRAWILRKPNI